MDGWTATDWFFREDHLMVAIIFRNGDARSSRSICRMGFILTYATVRVRRSAFLMNPGKFSPLMNTRTSTPTVTFEEDGDRNRRPRGLRGIFFGVPASDSSRAVAVVAVLDLAETLTSFSLRRSSRCWRGWALLTREFFLGCLGGRCLSGGQALFERHDFGSRLFVGFRKPAHAVLERSYFGHRLFEGSGKSDVPFRQVVDLCSDLSRNDSFRRRRGLVKLASDLCARVGPYHGDLFEQ